MVEAPGYFPYKNYNNIAVIVWSRLNTKTEFNRINCEESNTKKKNINQLPAWTTIGCSFKFPGKVDVEELIVNAPLV
jgi:hypothetical protein